MKIDAGGVEDLLNGVEEFSLHRPGVLLNLPTAIAGPFVFEEDFESCHEIERGTME